MDVHSAVGDGRMLRRVMALLVSFAVLAERAAARSAAGRWFVLWILRRAEMAAEEYFFEQTGMSLPSLEGFTAAGNSPADTLSLAARFYALAAAFATLLPLGRPIGWRRVRRGFASGHAATGGGRLLGGWTRKPHDTS